jgi:nucleotide-binding universal stress UspA family protein
MAALLYQEEPLTTMKPLTLNSLLVPVDFSPSSNWALDRALKLATGENPSVIILHVIDSSLVAFAESHGWGTQDEISSQMRETAQPMLDSYRNRGEKSGENSVEIDTIISTGVPFLEILKKAEDFDVDAIVMGKLGTRGPIDNLLFGSTAEKVIRGSRRPVIVLPFPE